MQPKQLIIALFLGIAFFSCKEDEKIPELNQLQTYVEPEPVKEFGFVLEDYIVKRDTIRKGDSFGEILERNQIGYPRIFNIAEKSQRQF